MMRLLANKKNVKVVSIVVSTIFVLGIAGLAYMQMETPAMASPNSQVGVVDTTKILTPESEVAKSLSDEMNAYIKESQTKFEQVSANMDDAQKEKLFADYQQKIQNKQMELQKSLGDQVKEATKTIADAKGLTVVLSKDVVLYGGVDITDQVAKKFAEVVKKGSDAKK